MTAIKSVVWAIVTSHRSFKFGPYVKTVASKSQCHHMLFKGIPLPTSGSGHVQNRALCDDLLTFLL